ncbi:MAG: hypothetical protein IPJ65_01175 [Archangiaceae bacterium]|nr:hypothetical protein [Archangiaceae bacterium]
MLFHPLPDARGPETGVNFSTPLCPSRGQRASHSATGARPPSQRLPTATAASVTALSGTHF